MTTESIKAKIANNDRLTQEEIDHLLDADIDALLEYEHVARMADDTGKSIVEVKAILAAVNQ